MANILEEELTDKVVVVSSEYFIGSEEDRMFYCKWGNGCSTKTWGTNIFGFFVKDREKCSVRGHKLSRLADEHEFKKFRNNIRLEMKEFNSS